MIYVLDAVHYNTSSSITFTEDTTAPTGSLSINDGDNATYTPSVTLSLTYNDDTGVRDCSFRNESLDWTPWVSCNATKSWTLSDPDGLREVQFRVRDYAGNIYIAASDTIFLNKTLYGQPFYSNFVNSPETTDFFIEVNYNNITNLTLANTFGEVKFPESYGVNVSNQDYDDNLIIGDCFVSVNTAGLHPSFNASAYLMINNSDGHCGDNRIYIADGFFSNADAIRSAAKLCTDCTGIQFTNGSITGFNIGHFSSYVVGSTAQLEIYDSYEGSSVPMGTDITFYANYTNSTTGIHISGADCNIRFGGSPTEYNMVESTGQYNYTTYFAVSGSQQFHVNCSATGYNTLNTSDGFDVSGIGVPEFNIVTLIAGLFIVLIGLIVIRRKN